MAGAVVRAEHHVVRTVAVHQVLDLAGFEDHGVEEELAQVFGGRLRNTFAHILAGPPAVVEPARVRRQIATAVHHDDLEVGMTLDDAVDNNNRLRIADQRAIRANLQQLVQDIYALPPR